MLEIVYWIIGVFALLFLISAALFFKDILRTGKVKLRKIKAREKESLWVIIVAYIICLGIIVGEFIKFRPEMTDISYAGLLLMLLGGVLRISARKELDRFFTFQVMIQEGHKLIKSGLFKYIRHPTYLGNIFLMLGLALALGTKFGIIAVIVFYVPAVIFRISGEEKMMIKEFGKEYLKYMEKTKKLIPFIY